MTQFEPQGEDRRQRVKPESEWEDRVADAVNFFWKTRDRQAAKHEESGKVDNGTGGAVRGGQHFAEMSRLIESIIEKAGLPPRKVGHVLPGYYRRNKDWDGVLVHKGQLVGILEYKSQVGSETNNQNNRIEEILGQSRDIYESHKSGLHGRLPPFGPWLAYLVIVEDSEKTRRPIGKSPSNTLNKDFPADPIFASAPSFIDRWAVALQRMRIEGDLGAACLIATEKSERVSVSSTGGTIEDHAYRYPSDALSFKAFAAALRGRVETALGALG